LISTPFIHPSMPTFASRHIYKNNKKVTMGHRGMGSFRSRSVAGLPSSIGENTILSYNIAHQRGASFIEFDVHLTSDLVPVVFHDFKLPFKTGKNPRFPIGSINLNHFLEIGSHPIAKKSMTTEDLDRYEMKPGRYGVQDSLPTLKDIFEKTPIDLGFDIEIKYPTKKKNQKAKLCHFERNLVVDRILQVVYDYSHQNRSIFFSSFDMQTCLLLRLKQSRYPVFLITHGGMYHDGFTSSVEEAVHFSVKDRLQGICSRGLPFIQNKKLFEFVSSHGLILANWGPETNDPVQVGLLFENGAFGMITDHEHKVK